MYTVLAITCHPDDMEDTCAGTLLKCKARGDRVVVCHASSGSMGHEVIMPDELKKIRLQEAQDAGEMAGFEILYGGFDDLEIYEHNKEAKDKLVKIIRQVNPDFIITHAPNDYMPDHVAVSKLVFDASFAATVPHYEPQIEGTARLVPIYYMDTCGSVDFNPTEYVDITDYIDKKMELLACHKSQVEWLANHTNVDYHEKIRTLAKCRGYQCGAEYAEVYRMCQVYLKGTTVRYLP